MVFHENGLFENRKNKNETKIDNFEGKHGPLTYVEMKYFDCLKIQQ